MEGCLTKCVELQDYVQKTSKKILKTTLLWTSRSIQGTKEKCYSGLQVSVLNPNSLCTPYASTCP